MVMRPLEGDFRTGAHCPFVAQAGGDRNSRFSKSRKPLPMRRISMGLQELTIIDAGEQTKLRQNLSKLPTLLLNPFGRCILKSR